MTTTPRITDHALIRWLDRAHGIDVEFFRERLAEQVGPVAGVGDLTLVADGLRYVVCDDALVTVVKASENRKRRRH